MRCILFSAFIAAAVAQSPQLAAIERQRAALATQRDSLGQQQASIRRQVPAGAAAPEHPFFTAPWVTAAELTAGISQDAPSTCEPLRPGELDELIRSSTTGGAITPDLLRALIRKESANYPCAVSSKGALGLMQLMPGTAEELKVANPFDPADNVRAGTQYLQSLLDRYGGDVVLALSAYNAGPARVDAAGGIPAIRETQDYVRSILGSVR